MIDKKTYLDLKKEVRSMCRVNVIKLCDDIQLNTNERKLLLSFYDDDSRTATCMKLSISEYYYKTHLKMIFTKINDYKNTLK